MVLFTPKGSSLNIPITKVFPRNIVHPDLLAIRARDSVKINNPTIRLSFKLLVKSILGIPLRLFRKRE
jgi:hypothetical protein